MGLTVLVKPANISFEAEPSEIVMRAGERAGIRWPTVCGGIGECGVCHVEVLGSPQMDEPNNAEVVVLRKMLTKARHGGTMRLACQMEVKESLELFRVGIRK